MMIALAVVFVGCGNPTGGETSAPTTPGADGGDTGGGTGGTGGDTGTVTPTPITITFELDVDAGGSFMLSTSHTAPEPITVLAGEPVRLTQGMGFTAEQAGAGPGESSVTFHASGWSTEAYISQFQKIMNPWEPAPSGPGYYLPGFEASFTEDTTLYIRWLPEYDNIAAQVTYHEPENASNTALGPILHVRDQVPFETTARFVERVSPSWTVVENHGIYEWRSVERAGYQPNATGAEPAVWQFYTGTFLEGPGDPGLRSITLSYTTRPVWTVTFDYNGATGGIGDLTRVAYDDVEARLNPGWDYIAPTRDGLRFGGWWTTRDSGGEVWSNGSTTISSASPAHSDWFTHVQSSFQRKVTSDMTLYARWIADVEFNTNGGSIDGFGALAQSVYVNAGDTGVVTAPSLNPAYEHDTFLGWYTDSALASQVSAGSSDISVSQSGTLFAGWGPDPQYAVGQSGPGGGLVFYIKDGTGARATSAQDWRFLEAAASDLPGTYEWGLNSTTEPDGLNPDSTWRPFGGSNEFSANNVLGGGLEFTNRILARLDVTSATYASVAARAAREYAGGGKGDWYLPTGPELQEMNNHRNILNLNTSGNTEDRYWSSVTEWSNPQNRAYAVQFFPAGFNPSVSVDEWGRGIAYRVRPVRRF